MSFFNKFKKALVPSCTKCGLDKKCQSPNMGVTGEGKKGILIIGEASGADEDEYGEQWMGEAGAKLRKALKNNRLDLDRDCWKINALGCRPTKTSDKGKVSNRTPTPKEIEYCRASVEKAIKELKPTYIWLLGGAALKSFYGTRQRKITVEKFRGLKFHDSTYDCWVFPTMHPSMLVRHKRDEYIASTFKLDIRRMAKFVGNPKPTYIDPFKSISCLTEYDDVITILKQVLKKKPPFFYDYESTGLKPYLKGHKIASISFAISKTEAYSFPYMYPHWTKPQLKKIRKLFVKILEDPDIEKAAQNLKFEDIWSRVILKATMRGQAWCTMDAAHVIDDRHMITGLKWQLFQRYGIEDYAKDVAAKLKAPKGTSLGTNAFNKVMEIPLPKLLKYGGVDSLGGFWLWKDQEIDINKLSKLGLDRARDFQFAGSKALTNSTYRGICIDEKFYDNRIEDLEFKINHLENKIHKSDEAKLWFKQKNDKIDFNSVDDLKELFFELMDYKPTQETDKGNVSLNADALEEIDSPFAKKIVRRRKLIKAVDNAKLIRRETTDGFMHPWFHLDRARTFRSTSSEPNFQNMIKHFLLGMQTVRGGIIPRPGGRLGGNDFGGIEVCVAGCYTQDPTLIGYINDPVNDMHSDSAAKIFKLDAINSKDKKIRFVGKNGWVFAQFYGSYYGSCARRIWVEVPKLHLIDGTPMIDHLKRKGIGTYAKFESHLKRVEMWFWDRFPVFREWQQKVLKHYLKTGRVEMFTGFIRQGQLSSNKVINTAIQGTAFHCLLKAFTILDEILFDEGWDTRLAGQIHDDMVSDIPDYEVKNYLELQNRVMTKMVPEAYPWIIVPLTTEAELTGIDKPYSTIKEVTRIDCECDSEWYFKGSKEKDKSHVCIDCGLEKAA